MNKVSLLGRLGKEPEFRNTTSGKKVANLRVATSEKYKGRDGEWQESTEWHSVTVWGDIDCERLEAARKGDEVVLEGKLTTRKWQDSAGKDQYTTEVVVQFPMGFVRIAVSDPKRGGTGGDTRSGGGGGWDSGTTRGAGGGTGTAQGGGRKPPPDMDDDIPFGPCWQ